MEQSDQASAPVRRDLRCLELSRTECLQHLQRTTIVMPVFRFDSQVAKNDSLGEAGAGLRRPLLEQPGDTGSGTRVAKVERN
jgi:hypothetical protein